MNTKKRPKEPWENKTNVPYSDEALKKVSQKWSRKTWEKYLESLESREHEEIEKCFGDQELLQHIQAKRGLFTSADSIYEEVDRRIHGDDDSESNTAFIQKKKLLMKAFNELSRRKRRALKLHYVHGYTLEEVSETLNIKLSTLQDFFERIHKELKSEIEFLELQKRSNR